MYFPKEVADPLKRISKSGYCLFIIPAKSPFPSFVGKDLFALIGASTFLNVRQDIRATFQDRTFCLRPFCKRGCSIFAQDVHYPGIITERLLFYQYQRLKKRSKRIPIKTVILIFYLRVRIISFNVCRTNSNTYYLF